MKLYWRTVLVISLSLSLAMPVYSKTLSAGNQELGSITVENKSDANQNIYLIRVYDASSNVLDSFSISKKALDSFAEEKGYGFRISRFLFVGAVFIGTSGLAGLLGFTKVGEKTNEFVAGSTNGWIAKSLALTSEEDTFIDDPDEFRSFILAIPETLQEATEFFEERESLYKENIDTRDDALFPNY